jgi:hypothetical protein
MADPICVKCSKPILPTDTASTDEQVDACTLVVQRVPYHAACRDDASGDGAPSRRHPRAGATDA